MKYEIKNIKIMKKIDTYEVWFSQAMDFVLKRGEFERNILSIQKPIMTSGGTS